MTTTTANIASYAVPLGSPIRRVYPGRVYGAEDFFPKKKKKKKRAKGVYELFMVGDEVLVEAVVPGRKYTLNGKTGVWRTVRGRKHFFPDDKSGTIPPIGSRVGGPI